MKKTFTLKHEKIKPARMAESARRDVRRYLKRQRKRELPEEMDLWEFDCRFGPTEAEAQTIDVADLLKAMNDAEAKQLESFYVEILAKPGKKIRNEELKMKNSSADETNTEESEGEEETDEG